MVLYLPSAVLTMPLFLLFNFVAFHTFNMSSGAMELAKLLGRPASTFLRFSSSADGVVEDAFEVGGCCGAGE